LAGTNGESGRYSRKAFGKDLRKVGYIFLEEKTIITERIRKERTTEEK